MSEGFVDRVLVQVIVNVARRRMRRQQEAEERGDAEKVADRFTSLSRILRAEMSVAIGRQRPAVDHHAYRPAMHPHAPGYGVTRDRDGDGATGRSNAACTNALIASIVATASAKNSWSLVSTAMT